MSVSQIDPALLAVTPVGLVAAGIVLPIVSFAAVGLRFYSRRWQRFRYGADDWMMLAGVCLVFVLGLVLVVGSATGVLGDDGPSTTQIPERVIMAYSLVEKVAFALVEASLVFTYRRIFKGCYLSRPSVVATLYSIITVVCIVFFFTSTTQCRAGNWETAFTLRAMNRSCVPQEITSLAFAITNTVVCLALLLLPVPIVMRLPTGLKVRACLASMFFFGTCSVLVGVIRVSFLLCYLYPVHDGYRSTVGIMSTTAVLSTCDLGIAVVVTCLPACGSLVAACLHIDIPGDSISFSRYPHGEAQSPRAPSFIPSSPPLESDTAPRSGYDRLEDIPEAEEQREVKHVEEIKAPTTPSKPNGSFGGAFPLQKISDAVSGKREEEQMAEMKKNFRRSISQLVQNSAVRSETPEVPVLCGTLRDYDPQRQCWS